MASLCAFYRKSSGEFFCFKATDNPCGEYDDYCLALDFIAGCEKHDISNYAFYQLGYVNPVTGKLRTLRTPKIIFDGKLCVDADGVFCVGGMRCAMAEKEN